MNGVAEQSAQPVLPGVTRQAATLTLCAFLVAVLLNLHHLAWWCTPLAAAAALWRWRSAWRTHELPSRKLRVGLVLLFTAGVLLSFRTLGGLNAGSTLMVAMGAAKLLETRSRRDWYVCLAVASFLVLAAGLDAQQLWRLPLAVGSLWLIAVCLHALGSESTTRSTLALFRHAGRGLLLALPAALLLFVFFPRLPGGFWGLQQGDAAITGLGEEMSPGSITQLADSDAPALRIRFDGALPPPEQRYWRGPVLHDFDGYTWSRSLSQAALQPELQFRGPAYTYDMSMEPAEHNVLITLEMAQSNNAPRARLSYDYQWSSMRPGVAARNYRATSYPEHRSADPMSTIGRRIDTRLPPNRNARSREFARGLRAAHRSERAYVGAVLEHFRTQGFEYTLTPPLLNLDSVDDFLFNSRRGFCGHFASSFVSLMRAAEVPARVVTGYLGGEWNPVGQYLIVRQSHAHAWAEVWLDGAGWTRVDPTAVVAPERLRRDIFDLIPGAARSTERALRAVPFIGGFIRSAEALAAWWQDRVVGFDFRRQSALLDRLPFDTNRLTGLVIILGGGAVVWLAWLIWQLRDRIRPARRTALQFMWTRLERKLARVGLRREPHESPNDFAERAGRSLPLHAAALAGLARDYSRLRYGKQSDTGSALKLARRIGAFELAR